MQPQERLWLPMREIVSIEAKLKQPWGIASLANSSEWLDRFGALSVDLRTEYDRLHDRQAEFLRSGRVIPAGLEREWYEFVARTEVSGLVHSQKYAYLLDLAAYVVAFYRSRGLKGSIIDIGSHVGYHVDIYDSLLPAEIIGVEQNRVAVNAGREQLGDRRKASLNCGDAHVYPLSRADLLVCADAFPKDRTALTVLMKKFWNAVMPSGFIVLAGDILSIRKGILAPIAEFIGLRLVDHDIIGGWCGAQDAFRNGLIIVLGAAGRKVPRDLYANWDGFAEYANDPSVPHQRKTQAFFLAHRQAGG
jgi:hypothetical protein